MREGWRLFEGGACLLFWPRGWALIRGRALITAWALPRWSVARGLSFLDTLAFYIFANYVLK